MDSVFLKEVITIAEDQEATQPASHRVLEDPSRCGCDMKSGLGCVMPEHQKSKQK